MAEALTFTLTLTPQVCYEPVVARKGTADDAVVEPGLEAVSRPSPLRPNPIPTHTLIPNHDLNSSAHLSSINFTLTLNQVSSTCGHRFHHKCIMRWFATDNHQERPSGPACRQKLDPAADVRPLGPDPNDWSPSVRLHANDPCLSH